MRELNASNFRSRELRALIIAEERVKRWIAPLSSIYGQLLEHSASRGVTLLEMTSSSIKAGVASIKAGVVSGRAWFGNDCPGLPDSISERLAAMQKARVLWQSLSLLSQYSEHVTIPQNFRICVRASAGAGVASRVNGTDIRTSCSAHPLIVDCLLTLPTLCT